MIKVISYISIVLILFFPTLAHTAPATTQQIKELLELSGTTKQISDFPDAIKQSIKHQSGGLPKPIIYLLEESVDKLILPADIIAEIEKRLQQNVQEGEAKELLKWYKSEPGKTITQAEIAASAPDAVQKVMEQTQSLQQQTSYVAFAKRLDDLLSITDMSLAIARFSSIAAYSAAMKTQSPDAPIDLTPIESILEAMESEMRTDIQNMVILLFVYAYQGIDQKSLGQYETFLKTQPAQKFHDFMKEGMVKGMEAAISKWTNDIGYILKDIPASKRHGSE